MNQITLDPTISIGSIAQVVSTLLTLFFVGRWTGKMEQRQKATEEDVREIKTGFITKAEAHALHSAQSLEHASIRREINAIAREAN